MVSPEACSGIVAARQGWIRQSCNCSPGSTIDVPSMFIAGSSDWGTYQRPGAFERMQETACTRMVGCHLIDGAGHWVQQEQAEKVSALLVEFLRRSGLGQTTAT